eukprot:Gb_20054 [translate_table: standard]
MAKRGQDIDKEVLVILLEFPVFMFLCVKRFVLVSEMKSGTVVMLLLSFLSHTFLFTEARFVMAPSTEINGHVHHQNNIISQLMNPNLKVAEVPAETEKVEETVYQLKNKPRNLLNEKRFPKPPIELLKPAMVDLDGQNHRPEGGLRSKLEAAKVKKFLRSPRIADMRSRRMEKDETTIRPSGHSPGIGHNDPPGQRH